MSRFLYFETLTANMKLGIERVQAHTRYNFAFTLCCHSNATCAPIENPPNSAQLGGIPYHSPSYIRVRAIV